MIFVKQPHPSNCCGQACVAMLAGISLEESISVFGKRGGTSTKDVVFALRKLNIPCDDKLTRINKHPKSDICIVVFRSKSDKRFSHWTVFNKGFYYNPAMGIGTSINEPHNNPFTDEWFAYEIEVHETSFLPIYLEAV